MPAKHSVKAKVPKARVMHANFGHVFADVHLTKSECKFSEDQIVANGNSEATHAVVPVSVLPFATAKQAREAVRVHNMKPHERAQMLADIIYDYNVSLEDGHDSLELAWKLLSALQFPAAGRNEG